MIKYLRPKYASIATNIQKLKFTHPMSEFKYEHREDKFGSYLQVVIDGVDSSSYPLSKKECNDMIEVIPLVLN